MSWTFLGNKDGKYPHAYYKQQMIICDLLLPSNELHHFRDGSFKARTSQPKLIIKRNSNKDSS